MVVSRHFRKFGNGIFTIFLLLLSNFISANPAPNGLAATTTFGSNPVYSPGIKPGVIVDEFGAIDETLSAQLQQEYQKKISEWASDNIAYGAYYNLISIETDLRFSLSSGAQINPDGSAVTSLENSKTVYTMSPTRQAFKDYLINSAKLAIDLGATHIFLDVGSLNFATYSFDDEVVTAFANHISEPGYDIRTLVTSAGYNKSADIDINNTTLNADAHWAQWIAYDKTIEREFFNEWSNALRSYAAGKSPSITVKLSANRYINQSEPGDTWLSADLFDYVLAETFLDATGYPSADLNHIYKTAVAFGKRFWSWNFPNNTDSLDDGTVNSSNNQPQNNADRLFVAQTFANGGLSQIAGASKTNYINHAVKPVTNIQDYQFVQQHATLFDLDEASEIGIVYGEYAINNDPGGVGNSFIGASYLISDSHRLWDVIFAADTNREGFVSDPFTLVKLSEYKTIILPHTQQLSDSQIATIESFLNADASHTVIGFGTVATHSELNVDLSASRSFDDLFGIDQVDTTTYTGTVIAFATDLGNSTADNASNSTVRTSNVTSFETVVSPNVTPEITTNLPQTIQLTRFVDSSDGSHIYHLVNTDYTYDAITTVATGKTITVPVPPSFAGEPVISLISPESSSPVTLTPSISGSNRTITLPALNIWTIIKVGSAISVPAAIDNLPWSQLNFYNSVETADDDAFDMNGIRPDTLNATGEFEFDYWYWKNADSEGNLLPFQLPYLATDDIGINQVELFYRYSAEYNVWSNWFSAFVDVSTINGVGIFSLTKAPYGDGHYQFYTRATDSNSQLEKNIKEPEAGIGIDTFGPPAPASFSESNGAQHGVWQTLVTNPAFNWTTPQDNFSGVKEGWLNIDDLSTGLTLASCTIADLTVTNMIDPASCATPLATLTDGRYNVRFRSKDIAGNTSQDFSIFELRVGTKIVDDPVNPIAIPGDKKITVVWQTPENTINYDSIKVYVSRVSDPDNIWSITNSLTINNPSTDTKLVIDNLVNGFEYRVAIEANSIANGGSPGDLIVLNQIVTPGIFSYSANLSHNGSLTSIIEGETDSYSLVLNAQPVDDITITIQSDDQVNVTPSTIVFNYNNWNTAQLITITAIDDSLVEGDLESLISLNVITSDANYFGSNINSISITVVDNDIAGTETTASDITNTTDTEINTGTDTTNTIASPSKRRSRNFFGCSMTNQSSGFDPVLPLLVLMSVIYLRCRKFH